MNFKSDRFRQGLTNRRRMNCQGGKLAVIVSSKYCQVEAESLSTEVILRQIIDKLEGMDTKLSGLDNKYEGMDNKLNRLENKIDGMGRRLDAVFEQTAMLTEFKTETEAALAEIIKPLKASMI